ncbi:MAG: biopolymer transporter ExbD [Candidatus Eisenbacteria sp.]|nr:biopolymer transporter ExbD [Candidatus Eisenbacteria bacterium]
MGFTKKRRLISALESTAMADIVFLLLIFFLLSSSFILQTGIKVDLPQVARPERQPQDIVITLDAQGEIQLDGYDIAWPQLREKLAARLSESSSKTVVIKGDAAVRLGRTVAVMDLARQLGAVQLALAARPGASEEQ